MWLFSGGRQRVAISPTNVPIPTECVVSEPLLAATDDISNSSSSSLFTDHDDQGSPSKGSPSKYRRRTRLPYGFHRTIDRLHRRSNHLYGLGLIAGGNVLFSLMTVLIKSAGKFLTAEETVFWRSAVALVLNGMQLKLGIPPFVVEKRFRHLLFVRATIGYVAMSLCFYAYSAMVLSEAQVIICSAPIVTFLLSVCFLGEIIDRVDFAAALVSFAGVVCVAHPTVLFGEPSATQPSHKATSSGAIVCAIMAAGLIGVINILIRKLSELNTWTLVTYFLLSCTTLSAAKITFLQHGFTLPTEPMQVVTILGIGILGCIGQVMITKGMQMEQAGIGAAMQYVNVVCVMIWDVTLLGESLHFSSVFGALVICGGAFTIAFRKSKKK
ncbi:Aste57867_12724 [Aphanomyces stellatus]|uniref:Aste57867_12724 protein n=1 Tax=Aphanomyces stellatus TaxID=120398 RepID=A0A485KWD8_9STRA|nr:hypothetical protein As57867_012676 [Aphanomyces stellatus]VFT89574.1 Aste57867_12724 [Aphanomyces stellatus]